MTPSDRARRLVDTLIKRTRVYATKENCHYGSGNLNERPQLEGSRTALLNYLQDLEKRPPEVKDPEKYTPLWVHDTNWEEINRKIDMYLDAIMSQREIILKAFIAETGLLPSECEQVVEGAKWYVRKRMVGPGGPDTSTQEGK